MNKDNFWYIILLPILIIVLMILSAIGLGDTELKKYDQLEKVPSQPIPSPTR